MPISGNTDKQMDLLAELLHKRVSELSTMQVITGEINWRKLNTEEHIIYNYIYIKYKRKYLIWANKNQQILSLLIGSRDWKGAQRGFHGTGHSVCIDQKFTYLYVLLQVELCPLKMYTLKH